MDFELDEEQAELKALAAKVIGEHTDPARVKAAEQGDGIDRELWAAMTQAGLLGVALPEAAGGAGYGVMEAAIVCEQVGRYVAPVPYLATTLAAMALGDDHPLLPAVASGDAILAIALEPGAPAPWAPLADACVVRAGDALYLVDRVAVGASGRGTARHPYADVTADTANGERLAAAPDDLRRAALALVCATAVGVCDGAVRITADYITEREQFGKPIATFQGATLRAADAYIDTEALRIATWSAIWRLAAGRAADDALAIAKFWAAEGGQRVVHAAQHLHGGMGVDTDYPIHRYFLWAKELELTLGGATQQLRQLGRSIAEGACSST